MRTPWKRLCSLITFALRLIAESHLEIHICVFTHWPNGWGTCLSQYEIALCCTVKAQANLNKESEMDGPDPDEGQREEIAQWQ